jgi:hypothetical protein
VRGSVACDKVAVWRHEGPWHCLLPPSSSFVGVEVVHAMGLVSEQGHAQDTGLLTLIFLAGRPGGSPNLDGVDRRVVAWDDPRSLMHMLVLVCGIMTWPPDLRQSPC